MDRKIDTSIKVRGVDTSENKNKQTKKSPCAQPEDQNERKVEGKVFLLAGSK